MGCPSLRGNNALGGLVEIGVENRLVMLNTGRLDNTANDTDACVAIGKLIDANCDKSSNQVQVGEDNSVVLEETYEQRGGQYPTLYDLPNRYLLQWEAELWTLHVPATK